MEGDFKGDFTRDTFDQTKQYSRVLMQQGRVQLDADWNEQADIILHYLRSLAADLIGPHGGPGSDFKISPITDKSGKQVSAKNFNIQPGHYYVDGLLVENKDSDTSGQPVPYTYLKQPGYLSATPDDFKVSKSYLVYLDVWERQITSLEDAIIREVALGVNGPDTATRAQVVWQVKLWERSNPDTAKLPKDDDKQGWTTYVKAWQQANRGRLQARANVRDQSITDVCITPPDARYRGAENQLYRVEIHSGGNAWSTAGGKAPAGTTGATFKWSRENGSIVFPYSNLTPNTQTATITVTLESLGRDEGRFRLQKDDWVEFLDDARYLHGDPGSLWRVTEIDPLALEVTLGNNKKADLPKNSQGLMRLWNYQAGKASQGGLQLADDGAAKVVEGAWLTLEDGIQIWFQSSQQPANYRTGDYWLIPARTATGDIEWPQQKDSSGNLTPQFIPPHGVEHHYAPLAVIGVTEQGVGVLSDLRYTLNPIVQ